MKVKDVKAIFPEATDEQIDQMLDIVHKETDVLRDERDKAVKKADPEGWKAKHDAVKDEYEKYKTAQQKKESDSAKREALKELLKDSFSEKGLEKAIKYADLDSIELNDKGAIREASKILSNMKEEWADYVTTTEETGTNTGNSNGAGAGASGAGAKKLTRAEILQIADASERQKAIMENPDAFRS